MKKISFLLLYILIYNQATAQFRNREMCKICIEIDSGAYNEALQSLSKMEKPELTNKSLKPFISYHFARFSIQKSHVFSETEAKNALDTVLITANLFETMPERGLFNRNTKNKLIRNCQLIDMNGDCFTKLEKFWSDTLARLKNESPNKLVQNKFNGPGINSPIIKNDPKRDSILSVLDESRKNSEQYKTLLQDSFKKSTIKATAKALKNKKSPAVNDSVSVDFTVQGVDSIKLEVYFIAHDSTQVISGKHQISEYCNEKVSTMIEYGVFDIMRRWYGLYKKDTLNITANVIGEADDIWTDTTQLQTFATDCYGIGDQIGLKIGDKVNNETIAILRSLNAQTFLKSGIKKTESFIKKNSKDKGGYVNMKSPNLFAKDWMKSTTVEKGPEFRKETIILKCNCN